MADLLQFQDVLSGTFKAAGTIGAGQPVGFDNLLAVADAHILGISKYDVIANDYSAVMYIGKCNVIAGGAITIGSYVKVGSSGKFLAADATALAAGKVVGKAMTAAAADGDTISVLFSGF